MLRCVIAEQKQSWDSTLVQVEFAYNSTVNKSTGRTPFSIVYTKELNPTIDLTILPKSAHAKAKQMATGYQKLIQELKVKIEEAKKHFKSQADIKR